MTEYKVGDRFVYIPTHQLVEITDKKPHFIGKWQYRVKRIDTIAPAKKVSHWINGKRFNKLFVAPKMAHLLYGIDVNAKLNFIKQMRTKYEKCYYPTCGCSSPAKCPC